jgi:hypothetical protein
MGMTAKIDQGELTTGPYHLCQETPRTGAGRRPMSVTATA